MARDISILDMRGFTLIELLVVSAIIVLMTALIVPGLRAGEQSLALNRSAHKVAQDIRRTMEFALRAQQSSACDASTGELSGYGIYFEASAPSSYILYANCSGENKEGYTDAGDRDIIIENISLDDSVQIGFVTPGDWSIAFFPPDPRIKVCTSDPCVGANQHDTASLTLIVISNPANTRTITVTKKGVIDID